MAIRLNDEELYNFYSPQDNGGDVNIGLPNDPIEFVPPEEEEFQLIPPSPTNPVFLPGPAPIETGGTIPPSQPSQPSQSIPIAPTPPSIFNPGVINQPTNQPNFTPPRGFAGGPQLNTSRNFTPPVGSTRAYRPNLKLPNASYWRGFSNQLGGPGVASRRGDQGFSGLRIGGVSGLDNPTTDPRRRLVDKAFGLG